MNFRIFFTPFEANQLLPEVKDRVSSILTCAREIRLLVSRELTIGNRARLEGLETEIKFLISDLEAKGCYYKDWNFEVGLVDFPAKLNGETVFLCWRSDESQVEWYHPVEEGYNGRRPIPEHFLKNFD